MLHRAIASFVVCLASLTAYCVQPKTQVMPEDQVKPGMHGVAYTVFEGVKPESMDVEILGVLKDMAGPKPTSSWRACTAPRWSTLALSRA